MWIIGVMPQSGRTGAHVTFCSVGGTNSAVLAAGGYGQLGAEHALTEPASGATTTSALRPDMSLRSRLA